MRQFLSLDRWPGLARIELKCDIEFLRLASRQGWVSGRMNGRFRKSLAWRKDLLEVLRSGPNGLPADGAELSDAPWNHLQDEADAAGGVPGEISERTVADEIRHFAAPAPEFEELLSDAGGGRPRRAKLIAFYLAQFHPFPENDSWWGPGFTEWTNVARAVPRFPGHYQPRIPRDLGFYDLRDDRTMRRQIEMAKQGGLYGFCFYYYNFDGRRLLHAPLERFLADPSLDMPFCLLWANENWTRRWDGAEAEILMQQTYGDDQTEALVDDFARHTRDPRYIRIEGRPLIIVYRPNVIPQMRRMLERWRELFEERHGERPLFFMAQGFGSEDPGEFGFDGAIEFPPHKIQHRAVPINESVELYDRKATGQIFRYRDFVTASLSFRAPKFPLAKTIFPSWDNDARRQGHGMATVGSTPQLYRYWLEKVIQYALRHPIGGENLVFINAWNEWAEGAYLEPDLHFGGAYLNETARAVAGIRPIFSKYKVVLVGHDAHPHGAQELLWNIADHLKNEFGCDIRILLCGEGPLLERYRELGETTVVSPETAAEVVADLARSGFRDAIVNSVASGWVVRALKDEYFNVVSLVHELPGIIASSNLRDAALTVAAESDRVVFPSSVVQSAFETNFGPIGGEQSVRPQGLYKEIKPVPDARASVREELGLAPDAKLVINVGYADMRKGVDLFAELARRGRAQGLHFVWVGLTEKPTIEALGKKLDLPNLHFIGQRSDIARLLSAADVFALTSREDPFPSVVMEAMAVGLPVVAFQEAGGFVDLFDSENMGALVAHGDVGAMLKAIRTELKQDPAIAAVRADERRARIAEQYSFRSYAFWLLQQIDPSLLRVSVVVPNYNYERYIERRLTSIFDQFYPIYELVVLDDASEDGSLDTINSTLASTGRKARLVADETNSGNVFRQWRKGLESAKGDLIWIAEADDLSSPWFLASLARKFEEPSVLMAFSDSVAIDQDGKQLSSYRSYYSKVEAGALSRSFIVEGADFAARFLSHRNVILNVSAVLWRRDALEAAIADAKPDVSTFSVAGD